MAAENKKDAVKTKEQLRAELDILRKRISDLEKAQTAHDEGAEIPETALPAFNVGQTHLKSVLDSIGDPLTIQDTDYRIIFENLAHKELMGDHEGEYCYRAYHNRDSTCERCLLAMSFRDGGVHRAERPATVDKKDIHVEITASVIKDSKDKIVAGIEIVRDVTERKLAEKEAESAGRFLASTLDSLDGFLAVMDRDLRVVLSNWKYHEFVTEKERKGHPHCYKIFKQQDSPCDYCPPMDTFADGKPRIYEDRNPVDGSFMEIRVTPISDDNGDVLFVMEYLQDVTKRKQAEELLKISEDKFSSSFHYSNDAIVLCDSEGNIIDANQKALNQFAYPRSDLVALSLDDLHPPEARAMSYEYRNKSLSKGFARFEIDYQKKNGRIFPAEVSASLFEAGGREILQYTIRDITKRRRNAEALAKANRELQRQNEELRELDRLKEGLIRDVSHELKTPVAKHAMQLEILKPIIEMHDLTKEEINALTVMEESVKRQENVVRNLLGLSRLESGGRNYCKEPIHLDEIISQVIDDYHYAIDAYGIEIVSDVQPVTIQSDGEMLWHLLSNLFNNAIKYRNRHGPARITVSIELRQDEVQIAIADNGIGVGDNEKQMLFTRFYQSSAASEGCGVGLAICKMIAEGLGGRVWIESEGKGKGTTSMVMVPLV